MVERRGGRTEEMENRISWEKDGWGRSRRKKEMCQRV